MQKLYERITEKAFVIPIKYFWQWGWETENQLQTNSEGVRQTQKVPKGPARSTERKKEVNKTGTDEKLSKVNS